MAARMRTINWESVWDQCQRNREETREGKRAPPTRVSPSASLSSSSEEAALQLSSYHRLTPKKKAPMTGTAEATQSHRDSTNTSGNERIPTALARVRADLDLTLLNNERPKSAERGVDESKREKAESLEAALEPTSNIGREGCLEMVIKDGSRGGSSESKGVEEKPVSIRFLGETDTSQKDNATTYEPKTPNLVADERVADGDGLVAVAEIASEDTSTPMAESPEVAIASFPSRNDLFDLGLTAEEPAGFATAESILTLTADEGTEEEYYEEEKEMDDKYTQVAYCSVHNTFLSLKTEGAGEEEREESGRDVDVSVRMATGGKSKPKKFGVKRRLGLIAASLGNIVLTKKKAKLSREEC